MDEFFTKKFCDRCGSSLENGRIMSMLNTDCICMKCKEEERHLPEYQRAIDAEYEALKSGYRNYPGLYR